MILFLIAALLVVFIGARVWLEARRRAAIPPDDDSEVRAAVEREYADADALVFRYLELFTDEPGPVVRSEKALPAPKETIKQAILKAMAVQHMRGALSEQRLGDYRSLYMDLAHFGSDEEASKSAAMYLAGAQFKAATDHTPREVSAVARVVGSYHDVDSSVLLRKVELRDDFTRRWQRMLSVAND
jgi:hypothetical protein